MCFSGPVQGFVQTKLSQTHVKTQGSICHQTAGKDKETQTSTSKYKQHLQTEIRPHILYDNKHKLLLHQVHFNIIVI